MGSEDALLRRLIPGYKHPDPPFVVQTFKTHHTGEHCIGLWGGKPWLFWRHPDGQWVSECPVTVPSFAPRTPGARIMSETKRRCPICGCRVRVRKDGRLASHTRVGGQRVTSDFYPACPGVGSLPAPPEPDQ